MIQLLLPLPLWLSRLFIVRSKREHLLIPTQHIRVQFQRVTSFDVVFSAHMQVMQFVNVPENVFQSNMYALGQFIRRTSNTFPSDLSHSYRNWASLRYKSCVYLDFRHLASHYDSPAVSQEASLRKIWKPHLVRPSVVVLVQCSRVICNILVFRIWNENVFLI